MLGEVETDGEATGVIEVDKQDVVETEDDRAFVVFNVDAIVVVNEVVVNDDEDEDDPEMGG